MRTLISTLTLFAIMALTRLHSESYELRVWVTFYCPCRRCCGADADGFTSTNKKIKGVPFRKSGGTPQYGIAADPRAIPYGSKIIFTGYTPSRYYPADYAWPVDDTGGDMQKAWRSPYEHPRVKDGTIPNERFVALDFRLRHHGNCLTLARRSGGWQTVTVIPPTRLAQAE